MLNKGHKSPVGLVVPLGKDICFKTLKEEFFVVVVEATKEMDQIFRPQWHIN